MAVSDGPSARQGRREAGTGSPRAGMRHLGVVGGMTNSVMLVLGDVMVAGWWRGSDNSENDWSTKGSDWERCYQALWGGSEYRQSALVAFDGGELLAFHIDSGGLVDVYSIGDALVLVEVSYTDLDDVKQDAGFLGYVASPFPDAATEAGSVVVSSGGIVILPASLSGQGAAAALPKAGLMDAAELPLDENDRGGDSGLVVGLPAGRYRVRVDRPVERAWGGACRAAIEPYPHAAR